jgi:hypothetical protein
VENAYIQGKRECLIRGYFLSEDTSSLEPTPEAECWDVIGTKV